MTLRSEAFKAPADADFATRASTKENMTVVPISQCSPPNFPSLSHSG
jgi:hypothetical protein